MSDGISRDDVAHLASLARIHLSDAELDRLAPELSVILDAVAQVSTAETTDVPPMTHAVPSSNVFRPDEVRSSLTPQDALAGAPSVDQQRFAVPRILGEDA